MVVRCDAPLQDKRRMRNNAFVLNPVSKVRVAPTNKRENGKENRK